MALQWCTITLLWKNFHTKIHWFYRQNTHIIISHSAWDDVSVSVHHNLSIFSLLTESKTLARAVLSQCFENDDNMCPAEYLSWSLTKAQIHYKIFDKEQLAMVLLFIQWRIYLEWNSKHLQVITSQKQAHWAEIFGGSYFEIKSRLGGELTKPNTISRKPDHVRSQKEDFNFGKLRRTSNTTAINTT